MITLVFLLTISTTTTFGRTVFSAPEIVNSIPKILNETFKSFVLSKKTLRDLPPDAHLAHITDVNVSKCKLNFTTGTCLPIR